jgi:hypothetical protein
LGQEPQHFARERSAAPQPIELAARVELGELSFTQALQHEASIEQRAQQRHLGAQPIGAETFQARGREIHAHQTAIVDQTRHLERDARAELGEQAIELGGGHADRGGRRARPRVPVVAGHEVREDEHPKRQQRGGLPDLVHVVADAELHLPREKALRFLSRHGGSLAEAPRQADPEWQGAAVPR